MIRSTPVIRKRLKAKKEVFMPLCYGILTLETSDCFFLPEHFEKSSSGGFEMKFLLFEAEWNV